MVMIDGVEYRPAEMQVETKWCETCDSNEEYLLEQFKHELEEAHQLRDDFRDNIGGIALSMADAEGYIRGIHMGIEIVKEAFEKEEVYHGKN